MATVTTAGGGSSSSTNPSLETLQLLASGSTNLAQLKKQQEEKGEGTDPELDAAIANQVMDYL